MLATVAWPLRWARLLGQQFFHKFGLHCATHQIRVILISCVVITSLFYPALDVYTSSRTSSQTIIDGLVFQGTATTTPVYAAKDLLNVWAAEDSLLLHDDPMTRARCQNGYALRVERVLVHNSRPEDGDNILLSIYQLEKNIEEVMQKTSPHIPCLKKSNGQCFVVSPIAFWGYDKNALTNDDNIFDTLSSSGNLSISGVPITPQMVLAGRGSYDTSDVSNPDKFDYASYLVLTYFFPQTSCWSSQTEIAEWSRIVQTAAGETGEVDPRITESTLVALEYDPHQGSTPQNFSAISAFVWCAYVGFFAYVVWSVRRMDKMHSRLGVTFTALVEISVSTITSLSVCALVGFKITMVPWEILPLVIAFVGAENMFNLVDAVGKTSVTLSVKERIAQGLSRAGTSNTLKVVFYNAILGVIAAFSEGAVRQFCAFALVVLVAHWFLAHTFFMAVLSIDLARVELEELLRHDTGLAPSVPSLATQNGKDSQKPKQPQTSLQKLVSTVKNLLKGRAATNISLLMLLAIAATLYFTTYTASDVVPPPLVTTPISKPHGAIARKMNDIPTSSFSAVTSPSHVADEQPAALQTSSIVHEPSISIAEQIWKTLNSVPTTLLHIRIELPTVVTFRDGPKSKHGSSRSMYTATTLHVVLWLISIMVLPIATTTGALYGLLLYLLKNTELLEAQRHRLGADDEVEDRDQLSAFTPGGRIDDTKSKPKTLEGEIEFGSLPRIFPSDVELVASSKDGKVVVSVGLRNEIAVWVSGSSSRPENGRSRCIASLDAGEELMKMMGAGLGNGVALSMMASASSSAAVSNLMTTITSVAIDEDGSCFAVGTASGMVASWWIVEIETEEGGKLGLRRLPIMIRESSTAAVRDIKFTPNKKSKGLARMPPLNGLGSEPNSPESKGKSKSRNQDPGHHISILATYETAAVVKWVVSRNPRDQPTMTTLISSRSTSAIRSLLIPLENRLLVAFCLDDGTLDLVDARNSTSTFLHECILQAGSPYDVVWKVHACQAEIEGSERLVVAAVTDSGVVSLWDGRTGECISILDEPAHGRVNQIRISPVQCQNCHFCGQMPMESLTIAFSVDHVVRFEKLYVDDTASPTSMTVRRCSCSRASAQLSKGQVLSRVSSRESLLFGGGKRSRSNSGTTTTSQSSSPRISRARLSTAFESNARAANFPVSGHGVHSRRASEKEKEKEGGRRSSELLTVPLIFPSSGSVGNSDDYDGSANGDGFGGSLTPTMTTQQPASIWRTATVVPLIDITCERGGWDVAGCVYMGVRRKSRSQGKLKTSATSSPKGIDEEGLTGATLERWEIWSFDPALVSTRSSSLVALVPKADSEAPHTTPSNNTLLKPRRPFPLSSVRSHSSTSSFSSSVSSTCSEFREQIPRLPFTRVSPTLITSSHAVAGFGNTIGVFKFSSRSHL